MNAPLRVVIAEDDYLVREGARAVLESVGSVEVLGAAATPDELLDLVEGTEVDAAVLDIQMPPSFTTEGIDLAKRLRRDRPELGIVILSQHSDPEYALELLGDGADAYGYLLKERLGDAEQLVQAIREVVSGGSVLDPRIVDALMSAQQSRSSSRLCDLTPRETEVLTLMAQGRSNAAIAGELYISERSVEKHTSSIFSKLGLSQESDLNRRVAAVVYYLQRAGRGAASR